jgi:hypothetical protein
MFLDANDFVMEKRYSRRARTVTNYNEDEIDKRLGFEADEDYVQIDEYAQPEEGKDSYNFSHVKHLFYIILFVYAILSF